MQINDVLKYDLDNKAKELYRIVSIFDEKCILVKLEVSKLIIDFANKREIISDIFQKKAQIVQDNYVKIFNENELTDAQKANLNFRYEVIHFIKSLYEEPECYIKKNITDMVKRASTEFNCSEVSIRKFIRLYWQGGKMRSNLLCELSLCGGKGKSKENKNNVKLGRKRKDGLDIGVRHVDEEVELKFKTIYKRHSLKGTSRERMHEILLSTYYTKQYDEYRSGESDVLNIPTIDQFKNWIKKESRSIDDIKRRLGEKDYNLLGRPLCSDSIYETFGPGYRYQVDSTPADIELVNAIDRQPIGKPNIYLAVDVYSRMVAGLHVCLGSSWTEVATLLFNCAENKVTYCQKYDIKIEQDEWPVEGVPECLLFDKGSEYITKDAKDFSREVNVTYEYTATGRGDSKGIVEQYFDILNTYTKDMLPGAVLKDKRHHQRDYNKQHAKLDIHQYTQFLIEIILNKINRRIANYPLTNEVAVESVEPKPIALWNWGIQNKSGYLKSIPKEKLCQYLMRKGTASITGQGIKFQKRYYTCEIAEKEEWYALARTGKVVKKQIYYDGEDIRYIYIHEKNSTEFIKCMLNPFKTSSKLFIKTTSQDDFECYQNKECIKMGKKKLNK